MAERELTLDDVAAAAQRAGLKLTEVEASKLLAGAARGRRWAEVVRTYARPDIEPAGVFRALRGQE